MAKIWPNGVPDEGRSPESGYRMAAEGKQFPWRGNGSTISTDLDVIWEMSVNKDLWYYALNGARRAAFASAATKQ